MKTGDLELRSMRGLALLACGASLAVVGLMQPVRVGQAVAGSILAIAGLWELVKMFRASRKNNAEGADK